MKLVLYIEVPDGAAEEGPVYPLVGSALRQYVAQVAANNQEMANTGSAIGLDGGPNEYRADNGVLIAECRVDDDPERARTFAGWIKKKIGLG